MRCTSTAGSSIPHVSTIPSICTGHNIARAQGDTALLLRGLFSRRRRELAEECADREEHVLGARFGRGGDRAVEGREALTRDVVVAAEAREQRELLCADAQRARDLRERETREDSKEEEGRRRRRGEECARCACAERGADGRTHRFWVVDRGADRVLRDVELVQGDERHLHAHEIRVVRYHLGPPRDGVRNAQPNAGPT
eukprot:763580-Rhodomonas_salina.1